MKVYYIITSIIPSRFANSVHAMKMCQALTENGHETTLVIPYRRFEMLRDVDDVYEFYDVKKDFKIARTLWIPKLGSLLLGFLATIYAKKNRADLVLTRTIEAAFFSCLFGIKTIFETHTPFTSERWHQKLMFKKVSQNPNLKKIVVISDALKQLLLNHHPIKSEQILVCHDGADHDPSLEHEKKATPVKVGYLGHLYPGRGIEVIIDCAKKNPRFEFHIVGGRPQDVIHWQNRTKENQNIIFHGFVSPAKAKEIRNTMNLLLAPYQSSVKTSSGMDTTQWMSPIKIFEYMASGIPMISSDLPVLREVLKDQVNCLLCPPQDSNAWSQAINKIVNDRELAKNISQNAKQDLKTKYTWKIRAKNIINS